MLEEAPKNEWISGVVAEFVKDTLKMQTNIV